MDALDTPSELNSDPEPTPEDGARAAWKAAGGMELASAQPTPGELAAEAFWEALHVSSRWAELTPTLQAAWEAAGQAVRARTRRKKGKR